MLRKLIESVAGPMSDTQFKALTLMLDEDIKFNRIHFKKRTSSQDLLGIAKISINLIRKTV
jgi:hypothetical protein